jgi:hypothetical protein
MHRFRIVLDVLLTGQFSPGVRLPGMVVLIGDDDRLCVLVDAFRQERLLDWVLRFQFPDLVEGPGARIGVRLRSRHHQHFLRNEKEVAL